MVLSIVSNERWTAVVDLDLLLLLSIDIVEGRIADWILDLDLIGFATPPMRSVEGEEMHDDVSEQSFFGGKLSLTHRY